MKKQTAIKVNAAIVQTNVSKNSRSSEIQNILIQGPFTRFIEENILQILHINSCLQSSGSSKTIHLSV